MNSNRGWRDPRGRLFGFLSETQRENFTAARARYCTGVNRAMPTCSATSRSGKQCRAPRMRNLTKCFCHSGGAVRRRLAAAILSGDAARIERAMLRSERNQLRTAWRRDPAVGGRTIELAAADAATCQAWARRQGFDLNDLDRNYPGIADACRWLWVRTTRDLVPDLDAKLARLRSRIEQASRA